MERIIQVVLCIAAFSFVLKATKKILHAALLVFVLWLALHFLLYPKEEETTDQEEWL